MAIHEKEKSKMAIPPRPFQTPEARMCGGRLKQHMELSPSISQRLNESSMRDSSGLTGGTGPSLQTHYCRDTLRRHIILDPASSVHVVTCPPALTPGWRSQSIQRIDRE